MFLTRADQTVRNCPTLRRIIREDDGQGRELLRDWYGRGGHWTFSGKYGKFYTILPTAHLISSPHSLPNVSVSSLLLGGKREITAGLLGEKFTSLC